MAKKAFNLVEWFNKKLEEKKEGIDTLNLKIKDIAAEIKLQLLDLKDDSHYMVPIINGLHGDSMAENGHPALVKMSFRYNSRDISVDRLDEIYDLCKHNGRLIIMVHGLMNDESVWHSNSKEPIQQLGSFLENQKKANILYIRYNTGRHISQNGRDLSTLIHKLTDKFKNKITELVLIGHSMGGLVLRSACYYAEVQKKDWTVLLKKIFLIGVPNEGSYLARIAYMTQYFLRKMDLTEKDSFAKFFDIRSNGIKDLSFGFLIDEDWKNPKYEKEKDIKASKIYPLQNIEYYLIAATVSNKKEKNRIFTFFGDGLVEKTSALSSLFKSNDSISGLIHFKLFTDENHISLLECKGVQEYMLQNLDWIK